MGRMKDLHITVYGGGDEAVAAVERIGKDWREQLEQAASEIEELQEQVPQWISVSQRLPEEYERVIGWRAGLVRAGEVWRNESGGWLCGDCEPAGGITHWMPLPEPPEVK